jgi:outer membrane receptor protein involved in Fe transport
MKNQQTPTNRTNRFSRYISLGLAASIALPLGFAQSASDVRTLQEENATLRKRLAELESRSSAAPAAPAARATAATSSSVAVPTPAKVEEDVTVLSPFEVRTDQDFGYLKTNSITATRIGTEIQRTPLGISIMSSDFLSDTNMQNVTDLLRYTATGSGDYNFAMQRPANGATPVGQFTDRGFQINTMLRNGTQRYTGFNLDNTDRVEIVKGPAALFFGQGAAGGVINYILKDPSFTKIPTTLTYTTGSDQKQKYVLDTNQSFGKNSALRIIGSYENSAGERR